MVWAPGAAAASSPAVTWAASVSFNAGPGWEATTLTGTLTVPAQAGGPAGTPVAVAIDLAGAPGAAMAVCSDGRSRPALRPGGPAGLLGLRLTHSAAAPPPAGWDAGLLGLRVTWYPLLPP